MTMQEPKTCLEKLTSWLVQLLICVFKKDILYVDFLWNFQIFKKVLIEVEKRIDNLRNILHTKLQKMPITVDNQKHLTRSLMNLEWNGDAAWDAITSRCSYITKQVVRTRDYHVQLEVTEDEQGFFFIH